MHINRYVPLIADGIALVMALVGGRFLLNRFQIGPTNIPDIAQQETSQLQILDVDAFVNLLLLISLYACFLIGFFIIRKLRGPATSALTGHRSPIASILALIFAVILTIVMTEMTAFFDNVATLQQLGEVGNGYVIMFTPAIFLFVSILYLFLLRQPPEQLYVKNGTAVAGLLGTNVFLIGMAAYVATAGSRWLDEASRPILLITSIILLALMHTLPRILYANRTKQSYSLLTYGLLLLIIPMLFIFAL